MMSRLTCNVKLSSEHIMLKTAGACKLLPRCLGPLNVLDKVTTVDHTVDSPAGFIPLFVLKCYVAMAAVKADSLSS